MIINTTSGALKGNFDNGLYLFKGIPYGYAKRFEAPVLSKWDGVLEAVNFSKKAPQIEKGKINLENISEDCLTLNVYTPSFDNKLPVLVEIHGGAFQNGSNQSMDPYRVIKDDQFIYVTINYRLGVLGYLYLDEFKTSGNNGTLDQLLALEWIKNNIESFGGDKNRITLLGSSAGAKAIGALMSVEKSFNLFDQVILISGAYQSVRSVETAKKATNKYMQILNISSQKELLNMDLKTILEAQQELCQQNSTCLLGPVSDGVVIPSDFYQRYHQGNYWKGSALMGCSKNELIYYEWMDPQLDDHIASIYHDLFGDKDVVALKETEILKSSMSNFKAYTKVLSDGMYRSYTYKMAQELVKQNNTVYQYGLELYPACHVLDHVLAFSAKEKLTQFFKTEEAMEKALEVSSLIRQAYVDFVVEGNPGWPSLNESSSQMIFDEQSQLRRVDLNEVCPLFEDEVYL